MNYIKLLGLMFVLSFSVHCTAQNTINVPIIPLPNQVTVRDGNFVFKDGLTIKAPKNSRAENLLVTKLISAAGIRLKPTNIKPNILLEIKQGDLGNEGYKLNITNTKIQIEAATENGLYYGVQSLLQLLPPQIESKSKVMASWKVPCVNITDTPRFSYRGVHLDCCRHFTSIAEIKKLMDVFAMYKINKFHWHLTEDQAWRIEIKRYPKLTQIGSVRMEDGKPYGGYYTQEQIKDLIQYAEARNIEIIPEIEMPGHALAALSAYPQYSCTGGPFSPRTLWGVEEDVFCAGNEDTYLFLQNILDEVCALFPSKYIHLGGDECPKARWEKCPKCQAVMKAHGLKTEMELQSYFTKRMEKYVETKGKRMFGWDEILEGGIAPSATIMSWRGEQGGIEAANAGHDVVMTPGSHLYLDHYQGDMLCEKVKIGGLSTLQHVYGYDPVPKAIAPEKAHHVLGLQGNLWQEYMYEPKQIEFQYFPRLTAIAETGWTNPQNKSEKFFIERLDNHQIRWDLHDIDYYIPMPEGNVDYIQFSDKITLPFTTNRPVKMVYTLDGTEPTIKSKEYTQPIEIEKPTILKIRSVLPQGKLSPLRTIQLTQVKPYTGLAITESLQKGMNMRFVKDGNYNSVSQLSSVTNWKDTVVTSVNDFFKLKKREQAGGAAILTGYVFVDKDGLYTLHCLSDEFYLNDKLLIVNDKMKKNGKTDITVPLTAGYYPIKMVFLNRVYKGVLSEWMDARPTVRPVESSNREFPTPVYH